MRRMTNDSANLIEMIVCIAFFAMSCAILFQMLAIGITRSVESEDLTWASLKAQSIAETVKSSSALTGFLYGDASSENKINQVLEFDVNKQPVSNNKGVYRIVLDGSIEPQKSGDMLYYNISVEKQGEEIFELNSCKYFKAGVF